MPDNAEPVGDNTKLEDITKMAIDIKLFDFRISRSMGRHGAIGSFVGIVRFVKAPSFCIDLKLLNDPVSILRIIFGNECFNTGRIKDGHICFCRIDCLADRFCNINKVIEYKLQVIPKVLFEASDFRSIRDF